jgi:hypothetical protein
VITKLENGTIQNITGTTAGKILASEAYGNLPDAAIHGAAEATTDAISKALNEQATSGQGSSTGK